MLTNWHLLHMHRMRRFLPCDFAEKKSKMRKELEIHFPESLVKWVETEMMQNRERGQVSEGRAGKVRKQKWCRNASGA